MNTKQKAEAWLAFLVEITPTKHEQLGAEVIKRAGLVVRYD